MVIFTIEDTTLELAALAGEKIMAGMDRFGRLSQTFEQRIGVRARARLSRGLHWEP